ncbi:MAG TPA: hypothetical protein VF572_06365 [Candidatus Saccharimonadales bacterium]|jgi:hypothetical protein
MNILDRDLDECRTFSEISQWRAEKYKIDKKSGDDYTGILTNIYKEPTHFIYELLQNADDAKATTVKFVLSQDKIEFFHDGSKEFSLSDIISITGVGNSSKDTHSTDTHSPVAIGKFGVGFKAVFAVTDKPLIYSTTYNFQIENLSVPSEIPGRDLEGFTTIFRFDLKPDSKTTLFQRNEALLRSMSPETILYLNNLCKVDILIADEQLPSIAVSRKEADRSFSRIQYQADDNAIELLKFSRDSCSIVYQLIDGVVTPVVGSRISVFFPTIIDSNLPFMVHAPFQTSTTRESIDFELPYNRLIVDKFSGLFSSSIDKLRSLGLFTVDVFNHSMPIDSMEETEDFPLYKKLQATFLEDIKSRPFVPTNRGGLMPATRVVLADDSEAVTLLDPVLNMNFAHRGLSAAATAFINRTGVRTFKPIHLLNLITEEKLNLHEQTDEWLYKLYGYCLKSMMRDNWMEIFRRTLKETAIIKTKSGSFTAAYFNDNPIVFRPSKGIPDHRTIHPMFLTEAIGVSDETKSRMKSFLSELGITERKPVIVLKEDYFKDYNDKTSDEKLEIFKAVADIYSQSEPKDKADIETFLRFISFVPSETGEYKHAADLYDSYNTDLKYLLGADHPEFFCSSFIGNNAAYREVCLKLGLIDHLKVKERIEFHTNREAFIKLYESVGSSQEYGTSTKDYKRTDYESVALAAVLSGTLTGDITARLAPLLLNILPDQFKETFEWTHYGAKKEVIGPSSVYKLLTEVAWIARDDQMVRTADISFDDFCDRYKLPRDNVLQNLPWSNDDIIKQLSDKEREAIQLMRELNLTSEEMHELRRTMLEKRKKSERLNTRISGTIDEQTDYEDQRETSPETDDIGEADTAQTVTAAHADTPLDDSLDASESYEAADTRNSHAVTTRVAAESTQSNVELEEREVLKGLIEWYEGDGYTTQAQGEDKASYTLRKGAKTIRILLLPKNQSGYNIEISENAKIIKTIAVIKADLEKKRFTISESQWNLSKRSDIQHSIYLVTRHGSSMSQIVIDDLRDRIQNGSVRTVPGVIYYE